MNVRGAIRMSTGLGSEKKLFDSSGCPLFNVFHHHTTTPPTHPRYFFAARVSPNHGEPIGFSMKKKAVWVQLWDWILFFVAEACKLRWESSPALDHLVRRS